MGPCYVTEVMHRNGVCTLKDMSEIGCESDIAGLGAEGSSR